jgi:hypothetical protein
MVEALGSYARSLGIFAYVYHLNLREGLGGDVAMLKRSIWNFTGPGIRVFYGEPVIAVSSFAVPGVALRWSLTAEEEFDVSPGDVFLLDTVEVGRSSEWVSGSIFRMREEQDGPRLVYIAGDVWVAVKDLVLCELSVIPRILGFVHEVRLLHVG